MQPLSENHYNQIVMSELKLQKYKKFQDIGVGDYVRFRGSNYQVFVRYDEETSPQLHLTNNIHYKMPVYDYKQIDLIESMTPMTV